MGATWPCQCCGGKTEIRKNGNTGNAFGTDLEQRATRDDYEHEHEHDYWREHDYEHD